MWLRAFLITQLIEMPIYLVALRGKPLLWKLGIAFGASALTHPIVWSATGRLSTEATFWVVLTFAETFAVITEGLFLHLIGLKKALLWAFVANAVSFLVGLALEDFIT